MQAMLKLLKKSQYAQSSAPVTCCTHHPYFLFLFSLFLLNSILNERNTHLTIVCGFLYFNPFNINPSSYSSLWSNTRMGKLIISLLLYFHGIWFNILLISHSNDENSFFDHWIKTSRVFPSPIVFSYTDCQKRWISKLAVKARFKNWNKTF